MANVSEITTNALARLGMVGAGRIASSADLELGRRTLADMLRRFIYSGTLGGRTSKTTSGETYTAGENEHLVRALETTSIVLPEKVVDRSASTDDYGTETALSLRYPRDGAFVIITDPYTDTTAEYIYDSAAKKWLVISDFTQTTPVPFSTRDKEGLVASLAAELADYFGAEIPAATVQLQMRFKQSLTADTTQNDVSDYTVVKFF